MLVRQFEGVNATIVSHAVHDKRCISNIFLDKTAAKDCLLIDYLLRASAAILQHTQFSCLPTRRNK